MAIAMRDACDGGLHSSNVQRDARWTASTRDMRWGSSDSMWSRISDRDILLMRAVLDSLHRATGNAGSTAAQRAARTESAVARLRCCKLMAVWLATESSPLCALGYGVMTGAPSASPRHRAQRARVRRDLCNFFSRTSSRHLVDRWRRLLPPAPARRGQITDARWPIQVRELSCSSPRSAEAVELIACAGRRSAAGTCAGLAGAELFHCPASRRVHPASPRCMLRRRPRTEGAGAGVDSAGESRASLPPVRHLPEEHTAPAAPRCAALAYTASTSVAVDASRQSDYSVQVTERHTAAAACPGALGQVVADVVCGRRVRRVGRDVAMSGPKCDRT